MPRVHATSPSELAPYDNGPGGKPGAAAMRKEIRLVPETNPALADDEGGDEGDDLVRG